MVMTKTEGKGKGAPKGGKGKEGRREGRREKAEGRKEGIGDRRGFATMRFCDSIFSLSLTGGRRRCRLTPFSNVLLAWGY